jgi:hypothetical protein
MSSRGRSALGGRRFRYFKPKIDKGETRPDGKSFEKAAVAVAACEEKEDAGLSDGLRFHRRRQRHAPQNG